MGFKKKTSVGVREDSLHDGQPNKAVDENVASALQKEYKTAI